MAKKKEEMPAIIENIVPTTLDDLMGDRFDIYAKDVIQDRAIPDARDGLKPVQRRIVYAMYKTGNTIDKPTKKCAHIVGEVMGKYHPHGDSSIYEALVRMSQTWAMRLPLIDFQGNNGSMDGDGAAAYRYTEARLAALSNELIRDIDKNTVDMGLSFDDSDFEPLVLPARFPNLLVNGTTGIAVGMATDIPPHNLKEVVSAIIYRIQHPTCPIEALMRLVPGPDFPTGGIIYRSQGLNDIYLTGRGKVEVVSKAEIVEEGNKTQIIVSEIPYGITKSSLVGAIDKLRHDKSLPGIEEVRDETDKTGVRIAIDIKPGFKPEAILNYLYSKTTLRSSFSANMVAIVDGRPVTMDLLSYCDTYIAHQDEVITRRCKFDLAKNEARLLIVEGLIKAASIIDEVVAIIRASKDKADSKKNLENRFGFTPEQSEAIVMMPLYKLSHFDVEVVIAEGKSLRESIAYLKSILSSKENLDALLIDDLRKVSKTYGDARRTVIEDNDKAKKAVDARDLIAKETVMLTVTRDGYVKRSSLASWKGSGGQNGARPGLKSGDTLVFNQKVGTTDYLVMFTTKGNYLYVPIHILKANKWLEEGFHVNYAVSLPADEKIVKAFACASFPTSMAFTLLSKKGQIKRTRLSAFPVTRFNRPVRAMRLLTDDEVVGVELTAGDSDLLVMTGSGLAARYSESAVPLSGTSAAGVKAGSFKGAACAALLSFKEGEGNKFIVITNLAHTRVVSLNNVPATDRLGKPTILFKSFKGEPHDLVYADKVGDREAPLTYTCVLSDGSEKEITVPDLYLTPMEKYAKKTERLPKDAVVASVMGEGQEVLERGAKGVIEDEPASKIVEIAEEETTSFTSSEEKDTVINERFEQISIFGDDF